jgi:beta-mannosidase
VPPMADDAAILLDGPWEVAQYNGLGATAADMSHGALDWIEARVPGSVHYDLVRAGKLANPFASSDDAAAALWVSRSGWVYKTSFDAIPDLSDTEVELQIDGIDTYSDVWLNGRLVGSTVNALRSYSLRFDGSELSATDNVLLVHVKSHHHVIEPKLELARQRLKVQDRSDERLVKSLVRRYQRNMHAGSSLLNLGVHVLGIGIYKPMRLVAVSHARIADVHVTIENLDPASADVRVEVLVDTPGDELLTVEVTLTEPGTARPVGACVLGLDSAHAIGSVHLTAAQLWWPKGYGAQPLYGLDIRLLRAGKAIDTLNKRIGLRTVELIRETETGRRTFQLLINGTPVYVRGTNFVPVDYLSVHGPPEVYQRLWTLMNSGNYNLVRLWGGGAIEDEEFYNACDENGIMIWQDVLLHSTTYPDYDADFVEEFAGEVSDLLRRVRNHPSLTVVCGGNEQWEGWEERNWQSDVDQFYGASLSREVSGRLAHELCPTVPFVVNSPHGEPSASSPVDGDTHTWGNFFNSTKDPQFVTETCWGQESYSRPETLKTSMNLDVDALAGPHWHHEWTRITGRPVIIKFPYSSYDAKKSAREYLRNLEIEQAQADYHALSMLRLRSSSCSGIVYWSFNKGGPLFGFGCVDYGGFPMMSYYVVKRLFAEIVVGVYRDIDDVRVVASNATAKAVTAELRMRYLDVDGLVREQKSVTSTLSAGAVTRVLDLPSYYSRVGNRTREVIHVELLIDDVTVSEDTLYFCPLSEVAVAKSAGLSVDVTPVDRGVWELEITTNRLVKMVEIEINGRAVMSDNYFALMPGSTRRVQLTLLESAEQGFDPAISVSALGSVDAVEMTLTGVDAARSRVAVS